MDHLKQHQAGLNLQQEKEHHQTTIIPLEQPIHHPLSQPLLLRTPLDPVLSTHPPHPFPLLSTLLPQHLQHLAFLTSVTVPRQRQALCLFHHPNSQPRPPHLPLIHPLNFFLSIVQLQQASLHCPRPQHLTHHR